MFYAFPDLGALIHSTNMRRLTARLLLWFALAGTFVPPALAPLLRHHMPAACARRHPSVMAQAPKLTGARFTAQVAAIKAAVVESRPLGQPFQNPRWQSLSLIMSMSARGPECPKSAKAKTDGMMARKAIPYPGSVCSWPRNLHGNRNHHRVGGHRTPEFLPVAFRIGVHMEFPKSSMLYIYVKSSFASRGKVKRKKRGCA